MDNNINHVEIKNNKLFYKFHNALLGKVGYISIRNDKTDQFFAVDVVDESTKKQYKTSLSSDDWNDRLYGVFLIENTNNSTLYNDNNRKCLAFFERKQDAEEAFNALEQCWLISDNILENKNGENKSQEFSKCFKICPCDIMIFVTVTLLVFLMCLFISQITTSHGFYKNYKNHNYYTPNYSMNQHVNQHVNQHLKTHENKNSLNQNYSSNNSVHHNENYGIGNSYAPNHSVNKSKSHTYKMATGHKTINQPNQKSSNSNNKIKSNKQQSHQSNQKQHEQANNKKQINLHHNTNNQAQLIKSNTKNNLLKKNSGKVTKKQIKNIMNKNTSKLTKQDFVNVSKNFWQSLSNKQKSNFKTIVKERRAVQKANHNHNKKKVKKLKKKTINDINNMLNNLNQFQTKELNFIKKHNKSMIAKTNQNQIHHKNINHKNKKQSNNGISQKAQRKINDQIRHHAMNQKNIRIKDNEDQLKQKINKRSNSHHEASRANRKKKHIPTQAGNRLIQKMKKDQ